MTEAEIRARIAELEDKIERAPGWGAALTAWNEELHQLYQMLPAVWRLPSEEDDSA